MVSSLGKIRPQANSQETGQQDKIAEIGKNSDFGGYPADQRNFKEEDEEANPKKSVVLPG
jgi:hypothetical protein